MNRRGVGPWRRPQQSDRLKLGLNNLYILPTRFGWWWLAGSGLLLVLGIQLQRNGALLLGFLMLALFQLVLHLTHSNLQGLELSCGEPRAGFAGSPLAYPLTATCTSRCEGLTCQLGNGPWSGPMLLTAGEHRLSLPWTPRQRGRQRPGLLRLQTTAPLGLCRCWGRWEPSAEQLIYPRRRPGPVAGVSGEERSSASGTSRSRVEGLEDWSDLRRHRPQDSPARLAWKLLAQGRGRHAKTFEASPDPPALLAPSREVPHEEALEHLSERIWRWHGLGRAYGLVLGPQVIPAAVGRSQRDRCLAALAISTPPPQR